MAGKVFHEACAAHNCLKPRWREGWCVSHWYAHRARLQLQADAEGATDSLTICEAIWDAS